MELKDALKQLDPANLDHWTTDGSPLLESVKELMGDEGKTLTRAKLVAEFPNFNRTNPFVDAEQVDHAASESAEVESSGEANLPPVSAPEIAAESESLMEDAEATHLQAYIVELNSELSGLKRNRDDINSRIFQIETSLNQATARLETGNRKDPVREYLQSRVNSIG